jgi:hypothetical protein
MTTESRGVVLLGRTAVLNWKRIRTIGVAGTGWPARTTARETAAVPGKP